MTMHPAEITDSTTNHSTIIGGRRRKRSTRKGMVRKTARKAYMKAGKKSRKRGHKKHHARKSKRC